MAMSLKDVRSIPSDHFNNGFYAQDILSVSQFDKSNLDYIFGVAHEMRNPLTTIRGYVQLLPEEGNDPAFVQELIAGHDAYINDAFGASHRAHASIVGPPQFLPSAAGRLLALEVGDDRLGGDDALGGSRAVGLQRPGPGGLGEGVAAVVQLGDRGVAGL